MDRSKRSKSEMLAQIAASGLLGTPRAAHVEADHAYREARTAQYVKDRDEVITNMDPEAWVVFCLRWGMQPPPKGFGDHEVILCVLHKIRMSLPNNGRFSNEQLVESALYLTAHNVKLPGSYQLQDGVLTLLGPAVEVSGG
jgi:hypothetical protein